MADIVVAKSNGTIHWVLMVTSFAIHLPLLSVFCTNGLPF